MGALGQRRRIGQDHPAGPGGRAVGAADNGFFLGAAFAMAAVIAAGFSLSVVLGHSSFTRSPLLVHAHAVVFMGWVVLYVAQNVFVATGNRALHRQLGWIGAGWVVAMLVLGPLVTVAMVRAGRVPFFFRPVHFLVFDMLTVIFFAGLTAAAIALRRHTGWHRRLHFCGMTLLLGPAFGRLLPVPLLQPWAYEAAFAATMLFPVTGVLADLRRTGRVHPAWAWGIGAIVAALGLTETLTYSPAGDALYAAVTAGSAGADVPPRAFAPPPPAPPAPAVTAAN